MNIIITYRVDKNSYHAAKIKHNISLITTEYTYGNELLVHLQMGKNLGIRLNNRLGDLMASGKSIPTEQFLFKKTYNHDEAKLITRSTFVTKLSRFNMSETVIEHEILEDYKYNDKNGLPGHVQVVIIDKADETIASIEFKDMGQYGSFTCPAWLNADTVE